MLTVRCCGTICVNFSYVYPNKGLIHFSADKWFRNEPSLGLQNLVKSRIVYVNYRFKDDFLLLQHWVLLIPRIKLYLFIIFSFVKKSYWKSLRFSALNKEFMTYVVQSQFLKRVQDICHQIKWMKRYAETEFTHFRPVFPLYTPPENLRNFRLCDIFRVYRKGTLA